MDSSNAWGTYVNNKKSLLSFKYHFQCVFAFRACQIVPFRFVPIRSVSFDRSFVVHLVAVRSRDDDGDNNDDVGDDR